jgi:alkanesulfonate monooxygenase SsuD/methylene tetrahydromethanopterin reductase-like flavin-dependent oxidoreductase (luciferase family)
MQEEIRSHQRERQMDIGISLPMRAYTSDELLRWAAILNDGPFASVTVGERVAYESHDGLTALAVVAGATRAIRLVTGVLVLPVHNEVMLAKQAATLDNLSSGRLVLGLGVGDRIDDFVATRSTWEQRGQRFEQQFEVMKRVWRGEAPYDGAQPVGPPLLRQGGPEIHIGGFSRIALQRAGRLADGLRSFDFKPDTALHRERYGVTLRAWEEAGRTGRPRLVASTFFALGDDAEAVYESSMRQYVNHDPKEAAYALEAKGLASPGAITDAIKRFEDAGVDEMGFATALRLGPEAADRLAEVVAKAG